MFIFVGHISYGTYEPGKVGSVMNRVWFNELKSGTGVYLTWLPLGWTSLSRPGSINTTESCGNNTLAIAVEGDTSMLSK